MLSSSDFIPYSSHISPKVIKLKGGDYLIAFKIEGMSYVGVESEVLDLKTAAIAKLLTSFKAPTRFNVYTQSHIIRYTTKPSLEGSFEKGFADSLNTAYVNRNIDNQDVMVTEHFLSVIFRPHHYLEKKGLALNTHKQFLKLEKKAIEQLDEIEGAILTAMNGYVVKTLTTYEHNERLYSETLEYLSLLINGHYKRVPVLQAQISEYLATATLEFGNSDIVLVKDSPHKIYTSMLAVSEYPNHTKAGCLSDLLNLNERMIITQTFLPKDRKTAVDELTRTLNRMKTGDESSSSEMSDLRKAIEDVTADKIVMGDYSLTVLLQSSSKEELLDYTSRAKIALSESGFSAVTSYLAMIDNYFSQLPGNIYYLTRKATLSNQNASQIVPFFLQCRGKKNQNPWGSAVSMLKTDTNDIFYFNFHAIDKDRDRTGELDAGFTMLAGSTGVGKTTVLSFLLAQSLRFQKKPKMIIFDKDSGSSVFVKALGGNYTKIKTGAHTGLQPFKCENTPRNVNFCTFLIKNITKREGVDFTAKEEDEITRAVITNLKAPSHLQSITAIRNNLPNDNDNSVYARLKSWIGDGVNAWVFDNHGDSFDFSGSGVNGIDYTEFLDNETVCTPILMYLFHKVEELIDGEPLILSMDEVWKPFQNKACADFINDKTRTIRKRNGIGVFSSQSPDDFINGVSSAFLEQMNTKIFLPNLNAKHSEYTKNDQGKGFGLTDEEFKLIKELPEKSRKFLVKQGSSSVVCKLDLHDVKELDILSGTEERAAIADELIAQYPNDWVNRYYDEVKKRRA